MPRRIALPYPDWPEPDRLAWELATAHGALFETSALAADWRPATRARAHGAYGRWLAFVQSTAPAALDDPPATRVTRALLQRYVEQLRRRISTMGVAAELQHLLLALRATAPASDWKWLQRAQATFQKQARPRDKRSKLIEPQRLLALGLKLMDEAEAARKPMEKARQFRDGLLIALLVCRPLRRRSLAALDVGRNVYREGDGYVLSLRDDDTKGGEPVEFGVPLVLAPYLTRYLDIYRPGFGGANATSSLWLSTKGGTLCAEAIYDLVCRRTRDAFGFAIHPHLFRDIAATAISREAPTLLPVARDLLTHANTATTQHHYVKARSIDAGRQHAATIAQLRATINRTRLTTQGDGHDEPG